MQRGLLLENALEGKLREEFWRHSEPTGSKKLGKRKETWLTTKIDNYGYWDYLRARGDGHPRTAILKRIGNVGKRRNRNSKL